MSFAASNVEIDGPYADELRRHGVEILGHPEVSSVQELLALRGKAFDIIWLSRHVVAAPCLAATRRCARDALVVFDTAGLQFPRRQREARVRRSAEHQRRAALAREQELALVRGTDVTIVVSELELTPLAAEVPGSDVRVIADVHIIRGLGPPFASRRDIFFLGNFSDQANVDAVRLYIEAVWPLVRRRRLPQARTFVIGGDLPASLGALARDGIVAMGHVPDLSPYLDGCRVSVAPLRFGAGIKGEIGTAQGAGVPVVATSVAVEGMHLSHGLDVLVADDAESFADAVVRLHEDESLWTRIAEGSLRHVAEHFSPAVAAEDLDALLTTAGARKAARVRVPGPLRREPGWFSCPRAMAVSATKRWCAVC